MLSGACIGIAACASLAASPSNNDLIGAWSRNPDGCARPELIFGPDRLDLQLDADGTPVRFSYPGIRYRFDGERVAVTLGSNHPYGKTASEQVLEFRQSRRDRLSLLRVDAAGTAFIRCSD